MRKNLIRSNPSPEQPPGLRKWAFRKGCFGEGFERTYFKNNPMVAMSLMQKRQLKKLMASLWADCKFWDYGITISTDMYDRNFHPLPASL
jgi:hypothetical protein